MSLQDKALEKKLFKKLDELERLNDAIGPTTLRHEISFNIVLIRRLIENFKEKP